MLVYQRVGISQAMPPGKVVRPSSRDGAQACHQQNGGAGIVSGAILIGEMDSYWKWPFIVDFPMKNGDFP